MKTYDAYDDRSQSAHRVPGYARTFMRTPNAALIERPLTLTERTGPLGTSPLGTSPLALDRDLAAVRADLTRRTPDGPRAQGPLIVVRGRVVDQDGKPVGGALVEVWQANASGKYMHEDDAFDAPLDPAFAGSGRIVADAEGRFELTTIKPGPYRAAPGSWRAPHIHFSVLGPSWMDRMVTQMHFPGEPLNSFDMILNAVGDARARSRLIARALPPEQESGDALTFEHTIILRGHG
ncbi:MAG TPA: protocatechuate 3,4-dioxygenase subunit beta [Acetobacteraceae bacterium]|nr:protocatechuate 3,4-dioxygenase subunit beta [Acetobacteraceae bacterium]